MKNKIIISVSLVLIVSLVFYVFKPKQDQKILGDTSNFDFILSDVNIHSSANDCWTVIDTGVYNLTEFISKHPGGEKILMACGTNATELFNGNSPLGRVHSELAEKLLSGMKIGDIRSN